LSRLRRSRPPLPRGPFLVVGLARSGEAAALALRARGEEVIGADAGARDREDLAAAAGRLRAAGVEVHLDASDDALAARAGTLIKSPGVPQDVPLVRAARARGIPVIGELELAWRLLPNEFVAVTGTNGKTTTTEWIGHIHRTAGVPVAVAGNVGTALSTLVGSLPPRATVVCEASSFQLEDAEDFGPEVAVLINLTPDHLDRHGTFENYAQAKRRIFARQTEADFAILPDDLELEPEGEAAQLRFGESPGATLRLADGELGWRGEPLAPASAIKLPGAHNIKNAMAAAAACLARELPPAAVAEGLHTFAGVRHRLELVTVRGGVSYIDDSKATNVDSTLVALRSFPGGIHLILGGKGKSQDFSRLGPLVSERCAAVYLIGEAADAIAPALAGTQVELISTGDLDHAVASAAHRASDGEVVLLSPACASFDQYRDYEARGEHFRALALGLTSRGD
jgi:UDP-N-acetylmuramoylalanine--D-glutamate ligase